MTNFSSPPASYVEHVARLERRLSTDDALRRAVGGEFIAIGKLEYHLLRSRGLKDNQFVIDVGCGSGRLACQLAPFPGIRYLGCDVVPRLLDYARDLCARPDWRFEPTNGTTIPCGSGEADFVCFFSVFTHLHQEEIYRYFREAHRVLKPGGLLVMSFLEFRVPSHWAAFVASVDQTREDQHLNQFVDRDSIRAWAAPAGFEVRTLHGGDTDYIPLPEDIIYEDGSRASGAASLGQSLAILQKPETSDPSGKASEAGICAAMTIASEKLQGADQPLPAGAPDAALLNMSARASVPRGGSFTAGFMIGGTCDRRILVRAIGPTLHIFGVPRPIENPTLELYAGDMRRACNFNGWGGSALLATAAATVGAFALAPESKDAALIATLPPGSYTAVTKGMTVADEGDVLIEVYLID